MSQFLPLSALATLRWKTGRAAAKTVTRPRTPLITLRVLRRRCRTATCTAIVPLLWNLTGLLARSLLRTARGLGRSQLKHWLLLFLLLVQMLLFVRLGLLLLLQLNLLLQLLLRLLLLQLQRLQRLRLLLRERQLHPWLLWLRWLQWLHRRVVSACMHQAGCALPGGCGTGTTRCCTCSRSSSARRSW